jgi:Na+-translocating ferredoxin:NAD+ oxidoreductase RNF subunit RnfB
MVECKHCGQKFRVPYRSAVVRLGEDEEMTAPGGDARAAIVPIVQVVAGARQGGTRRSG